MVLAREIARDLEHVGVPGDDRVDLGIGDRVEALDERGQGPR